MNIIGRENEKRIISKCLESRRPEFLVVYGRRRIGKTYLIKNFYPDRSEEEALDQIPTGVYG